MRGLPDSICSAICDYITVPPHIVACAAFCASDLLNGPSRVILPSGDVQKLTSDATQYFWGDEPEEDCEPGDVISEVYTGAVGKALRAFISDLPSTLYVDSDSGCVSTREPEGEVLEGEGEPDEEGNPTDVWVEPGEYYEVESREIVRALFGNTIATEFN